MIMFSHHLDMLVDDVQYKPDLIMKGTRHVISTIITIRHECWMIYGYQISCGGVNIFENLWYFIGDLLKSPNAAIYREITSVVFGKHNCVRCHCVWIHIHHYNDVIMCAIASQIANVSIVWSTVCSGVDKKKSSASLAFGGEFIGDR